VVGELSEVSGLGCTWLDLAILGARESVLQGKKIRQRVLLLSRLGGGSKEIDAPHSLASNLRYLIGQNRALGV
jgi:hypothetical protein